MNIIARYVYLSVKKNFAYRANGPLVILDEGMDCFSLWLFWNSLIELDLQLSGWTIQSLGAFMGFSLISSAVSNLFVGAWDIQERVNNGTLDNYLVKPCNPVLLLLLERANFLRFLVTFPAGLVLAGLYTPWEKIGSLFIGVVLCIHATVLLELVTIAMYELVFWLKKVDTGVDIFSTVLSVRQYPLIFFGKRITAFFTYVLPVAFIGTIPVELISGDSTPWSLSALGILSFGIVALTWSLWRAGRRRYESAN